MRKWKVQFSTCWMGGTFSRKKQKTSGGLKLPSLSNRLKTSTLTGDRLPGSSVTLGSATCGVSRGSAAVAQS